VLLRYYPAALEVFYSLASPITLEFIQAVRYVSMS
jgi:hypothetical protein